MENLQSLLADTEITLEHVEQILRSQRMMVQRDRAELQITTAELERSRLRAGGGPQEAA